MPKSRAGSSTRFDYVGFDEIQSMTFEQPNQIQAALKDYMEFGEVKGFDAQMTADAGIVVLGNVDSSKFNTDRNMVDAINPIFRESATLDRFHGFIPGWKIPGIRQDLIADGWALNTEYFAEVLHEMRGELVYSAIVDECLDVPHNAGKRDYAAVQRLCTAFTKLIFPHARHKSDILPGEFIKYCLEPALDMRRIIKKQLCAVDPGEFDVPEKRDIPDIRYRF
ncbi:MAG: BREX system Lon protease-like protein BrxL [Bacillota bacterium]